MRYEQKPSDRPAHLVRSEMIAVHLKSFDDDKFMIAPSIF